MTQRGLGLSRRTFLGLGLALAETADGLAGTFHFVLDVA